MASIVDQLREDYDQTPYAGAAFPETHPRSLATIASLCGLSPQPVNDCRVLEIGSAMGQNLLPMAQAMPGCRFLGLDLSPRNTEQADAIRRRLGLNEVEFRCQDIMEMDLREGPFDYIIAHGFYSWVPEGVRNRLLWICGEALSPHGVAYISYNTYPGWHLKRISRDLMLFHTRGLNSPKERLAKALAILNFAAQDSPSYAAYKELMKSAAATIPKRVNVLHDEMEAVNHPVYFEEFVKHARSHGLRYIGHANPSSGAVSLSQALRQQLQNLTSDQVGREQYLDFLTGRSYRASLLCRADALPGQPRGPAAVWKLHAAAWLNEDEGHGQAGPWQFTLPFNKRSLQMHNPQLAGVLRRLARQWPASVPVSELAEFEPKASEPDGSKGEVMSETLHSLYELGLIELHTRPVDFIAKASNSPRATALARLQAGEDAPVVNLRHQTIAPNAILSRLIRLLDGTRERQHLLREFKAMVKRGEFTINSYACEASDAEVQSAFDQLLKMLCDNSILCA